MSPSLRRHYLVEVGLVYRCTATRSLNTLVYSRQLEMLLDDRVFHGMQAVLEIHFQHNSAARVKLKAYVLADSQHSRQCSVDSGVLAEAKARLEDGDISGILRTRRSCRAIDAVKLCEFDPRLSNKHAQTSIRSSCPKGNHKRLSESRQGDRP